MNAFVCVCAHARTYARTRELVIKGPQGPTPIYPRPLLLIYLLCGSYYLPYSFPWDTGEMGKGLYKCYMLKAL